MDQNLDALDLTLGAEHLEALDRLSEPVLNFPARFLKNAANLMHNGATVNGEPTQPNPRFTKSPASQTSSGQRGFTSLASVF